MSRMGRKAISPALTPGELTGSLQPASPPALSAVQRLPAHSLTDSGTLPTHLSSPVCRRRPARASRRPLGHRRRQLSSTSITRCDTSSRPSSTRRRAPSQPTTTSTRAARPVRDHGRRTPIKGSMPMARCTLTRRRTRSASAASLSSSRRWRCVVCVPQPCTGIPPHKSSMLKHFLPPLRGSDRSLSILRCAD